MVAMSAFLPAFTIHPLSEKFPALSQKDFDELKESIRKNGLFEKIIVNSKRQVLDGRHRYKAITELGMDPGVLCVRFFELEVRGTKDLTEEQFIYDSNMKRRHLTESQRAAIAAEFANMRQGERTDLEPSDNCPKVSQERAGELFNVSSKSVRRAKNVKAKDPETFAKVKAGELSLNAAVKSVAAQEKVSSWSATDNQETNLDDTVEPTNTDESNSELEQMRAEKKAKPNEVFNAAIKSHSTRNVQKETTFEEYILGLLKGVMLTVNLEYPDKTKADVMSVLECCCPAFLDRGFHKAVNARVEEFLEQTIGPKLQQEQQQAERIMKSRNGIMDRKTFTKIRSCLHPDKVTDPKQKEVYNEAFLLFNRLEKRLLDEKDSPTQFTDIPKTRAEWEEAKRKADAARKAKRSAGAEVIVHDSEGGQS
jgi:hypothetical protein